MQDSERGTIGAILDDPQPGLFSAPVDAETPELEIPDLPPGAEVESARGTTVVSLTDPVIITYDDEDLSPDTTYQYRIRPVGADEEPGEWGELFYGTTFPEGAFAPSERGTISVILVDPSIPDVPTGVLVSAQSPSTVMVRNYAVPGATSYNIRYRRVL